MDLRMSLGEMKAKTNQTTFASTIIAVKDCAFEQAFLQIPANSVLDTFDAAFVPEII